MRGFHLLYQLWDAVWPGTYMFRLLTLLLSVWFVSFFSCLSQFGNRSPRLSASLSLSVSVPCSSTWPQSMTDWKRIGATHVHTKAAVRMQLFRQTRWPHVSICCGYKLKSYLIKSPYTETLPLKSISLQHRRSAGNCSLQRQQTLITL